FLHVMEVSDSGLVQDIVSFDPDDIDAAFAELDARYLAGEAVAHAHSWSVIAQISEAFNRHEFPSADWVIIDNRRGTPFAPRRGGDTNTIASTRAVWDLTPDLSGHIEAVHRLSNLGAVVTWAGHGTTQEGFEAEWRMIQVLTVEGDLINRCELFDEADVDAALARFDELDRQAPLLENAATRAWSRLADAFNRRDLDGVLAAGGAEAGYEDRRKGLGDEVDGPGRRKAVLAVFEMARSSWRMEVEPIAIRGDRLAVIRGCYRDIEDADRPIAVEFLNVLELGDDGRMQDSVSFDPDDINGAFAELTDRWIASGEVAHPEIVKSAHRLTQVTNRHDWDTFTTLGAGAAYVNHRQLSKPGVETIADHMSSFRTMASLVPDFWVEQAEVLTQSAIGVVTHVVVRGTSTDGVAIEIPLVAVMLFDGDRVTRVETFDADQRDQALARFEELSRSSH
ncbi:MAG: regulator, partial [Mycobacterium sp.]